MLGTPRWRAAIGNSLLIGFGATILATVLGTLTAIGLSDPKFPARRFVVPLLISPLIVPVVVTAVGTYLFYARVGLANTYAGIILAHTALASPFVVVTVGASLTGFDRNLMRAAAVLGAEPMTGFFRVMLPLILPACCPARHSPSSHRSTRSSSCSFWRMPSTARFRSKCSSASASS